MSQSIQDTQKAKATSLEYLCITCFNTIWKDRALGLTTREPQVCHRCNKPGICVMVNTVRKLSPKKQ